MKQSLAELREQEESAVEAMERAVGEMERNPGSHSAEGAFDDAAATHRKVSRQAAVEEARSAIPPEAVPVVESPEVAQAKRGLDSKTQKINGEPLVYTRYNGRSIMSDMYKAHQGVASARERLNTHMRQMMDTDTWGNVHEEQRAAITQTLGEGGELIAPVYLQEQWVGVPRAGSPIADSLHEMPWIHTNTVNYPKIKTGATVAVQTDTGSVSDTAITSELISGAAQTIAGEQEVSQQLVDLAMPGVDEVIFDDLARAFTTQLDVKVIAGTVTNAKGINELSGTNGITFTEATPKVGKFYSKLAKAIAEVNVNVFQTPDIIAMHPLRWAWMLAALDSQERPLIVPVGQPGFNAMGLETRVAAEAIVGNMFGIPVIVDASIPSTKGAGTNQDEVYTYRSEHLHLRKSVPVLRIFPEVLSSKMEVRYQLYGYYNAIFGRLPKAISIISGTGLAAPSF